MTWRIKYRDKHTGETKYHSYSGDRAGAKGWLEKLSEENKCEAKLYDDYDRQMRHVETKVHVDPWDSVREMRSRYGIR